MLIYHEPPTFMAKTCKNQEKHMIFSAFLKPKKDGIIEKSQSLMVARGDLGVSTSAKSGGLTLN